MPLELSIVIPAFNEEERLAESLKRIREYSKGRSLQFEVLVVDDESRTAPQHWWNGRDADFRSYA